MHAAPFGLPPKPFKHAHVYDPGVFVQLAFVAHGFDKHSFTSVQVTPLPVNPLLHAHVKPPVVFVQLALSEQLSVPAVHSFTSVQVTPLPV